MTLPRQLSTVPSSPYFDRETANRVDKVFVDGVHVANVVAYDMDAGWAFAKTNGCWQPKQYGIITVTESK